MNLAPEGPHLLDTSAIVLMMKMGMASTLEAIIPFITYAELLTGVERARSRIQEGRKLYVAIGVNPIIYPDMETLAAYGEISAQLQRIGLPLPTNDIWIAALALQHDLPLLTDDAHFARVQGLNILPVK